MWFLYDIYRTKKRSTPWVDMISLRRFLKYAALILPGFVIMYYRFKIMNFEGPFFTSNDNPTAFAKSFFSRVSLNTTRPKIIKEYLIFFIIKYL